MHSVLVVLMALANPGEVLDFGGKYNPNVYLALPVVMAGSDLQLTQLSETRFKYFSELEACG